MHVFYTERGLTVHHHSSRGRGNPKSFLSDAFHHNVKKSQTEREAALSAPAQAQKWEKKKSLLVSPYDLEPSRSAVRVGAQQKHEQTLLLLS